MRWAGQVLPDVGRQAAGSRRELWQREWRQRLKGREGLRPQGDGPQGSTPYRSD